MKIDEILEMTQKELQNKLEDLLEEMQNLRFQHATHQLDNPLRLRMVRKDIARIKTVLKEYEKGIREPRG